MLKRILLLPCLAAALSAAVVRVDVSDRSDVLGGKSFAINRSEPSACTTPVQPNLDCAVPEARRKHPSYVRSFAQQSRPGRLPTPFLPEPHRVSGAFAHMYRAAA